jgi:trehalose-phosphatase
MGCLALFLDFDGTLAPLKRHPDAVKLPRESRQLLEKLSGARDVRVMIVSGRSLKDLKRRIGLKGICYVGNHGLELEGPLIRYVNPKAKSVLPLMRRLSRLLQSRLKGIPGVYIENKRLTLSVHYRQVPRAKVPAFVKSFYGVVRPYMDGVQAVRITGGKKVFEVRPPVEWNKGVVVNWLLTRLKVSEGDRGIFPVYIGDDETDEDAFRAFRGRGMTVKVASTDASSLAQYRVESPREVRKLLRKFLDARG